MSSDNSALLTIISGSYRKHFDEMLALKRALTTERVTVTAPVSELVVNVGEEFALLDEDPIEDPRALQDSIFAMIRRSSFLVLANVDGYMGTAATMEVGYAIAQGLQILTLEPVSDPNIAGYTRTLSEVFPQIRCRFEDELRVVRPLDRDEVLAD
jgi:nucleoside 2-deoxyribosyltransferase